MDYGLVVIGDGGEERGGGRGKGGQIYWVRGG